ncbi:MAG: tyrosine-type recombinase/integrase [Dehalococcoidales bacterium]|nr:tyrosine-type recombinase/integrase [Dehalococcoidales bacterium]
MSYKLRREVVDGKVVGVSLGMSEVDAYFKFLRYRCRLNTWISYGYDLQIFLNFIEKPIAAVTPADILAFIESQQGASNRQGRTDGLSMQGPGLSNRTIKRRLTAVAGFYEYLRVFHDLPLQNNPVPRGLTKRSIFWSNRYGNAAVTPLIRAPETLPRPLNPEEISLFIDSLRNHRDKAMVLLMLLAGLRKSEVLKLARKDVDFGQRTLTVREGKGGYQRVVAISNTGLQELISYLNKERPAGGSDRIFLVMKGKHRGQPLTVAALDTIIEYHRDKAGTPGVQCHRMRHTCFTRLRQGGMSLEALQAQAGHRSIATTGVYLHLCPKELQQEYLRLSDSLFSPAAAGRRPDND